MGQLPLSHNQEIKYSAKASGFLLSKKYMEAASLKIVIVCTFRGTERVLFIDISPKGDRINL